MSESKQAHDTLKAVYEDRRATINGRDYDLTTTTHKVRRKVFAFFSKIGGELQRGDFSFLEYPDYQGIEKVIGDICLFDGIQISKLPDHWELYPQDYLTWVPTMLGAISYPFLAESAGG